MSSHALVRARTQPARRSSPRSSPAITTWPSTRRARRSFVHTSGGDGSADGVTDGLATPGRAERRAPAPAARTGAKAAIMRDASEQRAELPAEIDDRLWAVAPSPSAPAAGGGRVSRFARSVTERGRGDPRRQTGDRLRHARPRPAAPSRTLSPTWRSPMPTLEDQLRPLLDHAVDRPSVDSLRSVVRGRRQRRRLVPRRGSSACCRVSGGRRRDPPATTRKPCRPVRQPLHTPP